MLCHLFYLLLEDQFSDLYSVFVFTLCNFFDQTKSPPIFPNSTVSFDALVLFFYLFIYFLSLNIFFGKFFNHLLFSFWVNLEAKEDYPEE